MDYTILPLPPSLAPEFLRVSCKAEEVDHTHVEYTGALTDWYVGHAQQRLLDALEICLDSSTEKHLFIAGIEGPDALEAIKMHIISHLIAHKEEKRPSLKDYIYLYNFYDPLKPIICALDKGKGTLFKDDMHALLYNLQEQISLALRDGEVDEERVHIINETYQWWTDTQREFAQAAKEEGIYIFWRENVAHGAIINKERESGDGESPALYTPEEIQNMPEHQRGEILDREMRWGPRVRNLILQRDTRFQMMNKRIEDFERRVACACIVEIFRPIRHKWEQISRAYTDSRFGNIAEFCEALQIYTEDNFHLFIPHDHSHTHGDESRLRDLNPFIPWVIKLFVNNSEHVVVPVIVDSDGTFEGLVGRIERIVGMHGTAYTDHTMINAGSIAKANGGYLIVDAMSVLSNMGSYELLKRVIKNKSIKIEDMTSFAGWGSMIPIQPAVLPVNIKIIMIGTSRLWQILADYDSDFLTYFEKGEIVSDVECTTQETRTFAAWAQIYAQSKALPLFDPDAIARLQEYAGRLAQSQKRISTEFQKIEPIIIEAAHMAKKSHNHVIMRAHVVAALERRFYRSTLYYERYHELVRNKRIIIPFSGDAVGQITILSVTDLGDVQVGTPHLLTAMWSMGRPGFVSIAHESKMAGNILRKGELTVQGYLQSLFAKKYPLAINITYGEEQIYGPLDGDSASQALLYCIISAVSEIPIRQGIAITGSLSKHGAIQAIGGVNEKIEGFFDSCAQSVDGLTGNQGVIIPQSNVDELMLNERVVEAVACGTFYIWPIASINDGIKILMGREAGMQQKDYSFLPENSVFDITDKKLQSIAREARMFFSQDDGI